MNVDAVRKLTKKRISELGTTARQYAIGIGAEPNTIYLFLNGIGAYAQKAPKAVLKDLDLEAKTVTTYHKKAVI